MIHVVFCCVFFVLLRLVNDKRIIRGRIVELGLSGKIVSSKTMSMITIGMCAPMIFFKQHGKSFLLNRFIHWRRAEAQCLLFFSNGEVPPFFVFVEVTTVRLSDEAEGGMCDVVVSPSVCSPQRFFNDFHSI